MTLLRCMCGDLACLGGTLTSSLESIAPSVPPWRRKVAGNGFTDRPAWTPGYTVGVTVLDPQLDTTLLQPNVPTEPSTCLSSVRCNRQRASRSPTVHNLQRFCVSAGLAARIAGIALAFKDGPSILFPARFGALTQCHSGQVQMHRCRLPVAPSHTICTWLLATLGLYGMLRKWRLRRWCLTPNMQCSDMPPF
jgi:hypothetical protein